MNKHKMLDRYATSFMKLAGWRDWFSRSPDFGIDRRLIKMIERGELNSYALRALLKDPNTGVELQRLIVEHTDSPRVLKDLAKNQNTEPEIQMMIVQKTNDPDVLAALTDNPNTSQDVLNMIALQDEMSD